MTSTGTEIFFRSSVKSVWENATMPSYWAFAHDCVPPAVPVGQLGDQGGGLRAARPGQRPA
jgi:hypothetical protein